MYHGVVINHYFFRTGFKIKLLSKYGIYVIVSVVVVVVVVVVYLLLLIGTLQSFLCKFGNRC